MARTAQQKQRLQELRQRKQQQNLQNPFAVEQGGTQVAGGDPSRIGQPTSIKQRIGGAFPIIGGTVGATAGAIAGAAAGGIGAIPGGVIGGGGGAAAGELARQKFLGEPLQTGRVGLETLFGATGGLGGAGIRAGGRAATTAVAPQAGKVLQFATGVKKGSGEQFLKKFGDVSEFTTDNLEKLGNKIIQAKNNMQKIKNIEFGTALSNETARTGKGVVPVKVIEDLYAEAQRFLSINIPGEISEIPKKSIAAFNRSKAEVLKPLAGQTVVSVNNLVKARRLLKATIKQAKQDGIGTAGFERIRDGITKVTNAAHPEIAKANANQAFKFELLENLSTELGIPANAQKVDPGILRKLQKSVLNIFSDDIVTPDTLNKIDDALPTIDNFVDDLKSLSAGVEFSKISSGLARIGILQGVMGGGAIALLAGGSPAFLGPIALLGATSPRIVGAGIRGATKAGGVVAEAGGQLGARELLERGSRPFRTPQETDPARIAETARLSSKLGFTGQQELRRVPGTDLSRSLSGNMIVSTPKANVNIDAPLDDLFTIDRNRIATGRSRAIGR